MEVEGGDVGGENQTSANQGPFSWFVLKAIIKALISKLS